MTASARTFASLVPFVHVRLTHTCSALRLVQLSTNIGELREDHHTKTRLLGIIPQMYEARSGEHNRHLKLLADTYGILRRCAVSMVNSACVVIPLGIVT